MLDLKIKNILAQYDHIIWDWNGTLLDDVEIAVAAMQELLQNYDLPEIDVASYRDVFCFPVREYYEKIGFDLGEHPFEVVGREFIEIYERRVRAAQLFQGSEEVLQDNLDRGVQQSILSAASQRHLEKVVENFSIKHFFSNIYGIAHDYADSKVARGYELIQTAQIKTDKTLLIGDTDHDYEVGKELGVEVLLIADGHQSYQRLKDVHHQVLKTRY